MGCSMPGKLRTLKCGSLTTIAAPVVDRPGSTAQLFEPSLGIHAETRECKLEVSFRLELWASEPSVALMNS